MSHAELYLFKAARRPLYRKENLQLLAAERGCMFEVAYNRTWVAPELLDDGAIVPGARVYLVFTDRPYEQFVPVRGGEVAQATWDELMLRLKVVLGNPIGLVGGGPTGLARLLKQLRPSQVPGEKFVTAKRDDVAFTQYFDDREDEGWRGVVDGLLAMSAASDERAYERSVLFRSVGLRVDGELHAARRLPLKVGVATSLELDFYNPHLTADDVARFELRTFAPDDTLRVTAPSQLRGDGRLELPLEVLNDEVAPSLVVQIGPAPAEHCSVTVHFPARGSGVRPALSQAADVRQGAHEARDAVLRLYEVVRRNATFDAPGELDALDAFEGLLPGEQRLAERRAQLLAEMGDEAAAYRLLRGLDPELMGDELRFLLFRLSVRHGEPSALAHEAQSLELTAEGRFDRFVRELA